MRFRLLAALFVLTTIAGCSGVRVFDPGDGQNYYNGAFEFATKDGTIDTIVRGSPFVGAAAEDTPELTTQHMRGATLGRVVTFKPVPWTAPGNEFRIVVLFNGKYPFLPQDICRNAPGIAARPAGGETMMYATFCQGDYLISYSAGLVDGLSGPQDPRFRELVRRVTLTMIPAVDMNELSNDGGIVP